MELPLAGTDGAGGGSAPGAGKVVEGKADGAPGAGVNPPGGAGRAGVSEDEANEV